MKDKAYSEELNKPISKFDIEKLKMNGLLTNQYAFHCLTSDCKIPIMIKAWESTKVKPYFSPAHPKEQPHCFRCPYASKSDSDKRISDKSSNIYQIIQDGGLASIGSPKKTGSAIKHNTSVEVENGKRSAISSSSSINSHSEQIHHHRQHTDDLDIIVKSFLEDDISNEVLFKTSFSFEDPQRNPINGLKIMNSYGNQTLNQVFYEVDESIPIHSFHIFHGEVYLRQLNETLIQIVFLNNSSIELFTNLPKLKTLEEWDIIYSSLLFGHHLRLFCEGAMFPYKNKFKKDTLKLVTVTKEIYKVLLFKEFQNLSPSPYE